MKIALLAATLLLLSCRTSERFINRATDQNRVKIERIIDTINIISRDTTSLRALLECDSLGRVRIAELKTQDSEMARLKASLKNNRIDFQVETKYIERIKEVIKIDTLYIEKTVTDHQRVVIQIAWWQKGLMWIGVLFVLFIAYKIVRSRFNVFK